MGEASKVMGGILKVMGMVLKVMEMVPKVIGGVHSPKVVGSQCDGRSSKVDGRGP